ERVRAYTALIAEELKLPAEEIEKLRWAGLLHDLGKLEVPSGILNKKGALDDHEWELVKAHPAAGARIAAPLAGWLGDAFRAIAEHHERWDGAGYPQNLAGEDISLGGRIVSVADAFDVMTAARSYKRPNSPSWARAELVRCAGTQFDPVVVRAFLNVSLGRLRWTMGPLSWIAQLPLLAQAPIASVTGTVATTALAATVAVGGATLVGALPVAAAAAPASAPVVANVHATSETLLVVDPVTGETVALTTTTSTAGPATPTADRASSPTTTAAATTMTTVAAPPVSAAPTTVPAPGSVTPTTAPPTTVPPTTAPPTPAVSTTAAVPVTLPLPVTVPVVVTIPVAVTTTAAPATTTTTRPPATTTTTTSSGNRPPVAVNDSGVIRSVLLGLLARVDVNVVNNDSDPDGDSLSIVSFTQPASGTVTQHGDKLRYEILIAQPATFTYTISDGRGHTATATVTVTLG
ncbi:MAG: hypothetical protein QOD72_2426, partial [Acidimicrobiaceae bacterium]|nr:hypothetical protein [Acidimicrobiaceae bacterium]